MMAASECGRDVAYFTFGDDEFRDRFADLLLQLRYRAKAVTVGELYRILTSYW